MIQSNIIPFQPKNDAMARFNRVLNTVCNVLNVICIAISLSVICLTLLYVRSTVWG